MKSILEELYDGNIYPDELIISKDPEYRPLSKRISDMLTMWKRKLSEDDYNQLKNLREGYLLLLRYSTDDQFHVQQL